MSAGRLAAAAALLLLGAGCSRGARPALPTGNGTPFPGFEAVYAEATAGCRNAKSVGAELRLSGRAGDQRLRGTISADLLAPSSVRLVGVYLSRPIFYLVARDADGTLLLPRDNRVVRNEPPGEIIEALAGVALTPADLRAAVAGCALGTAVPANGRMFSNDWAAVDAGGQTTYLRRVEGRWQVAGALRDRLTLLYADFKGGRASTIHVRTGSDTDITLRVSQLEINADIPDKAFELNIPPDVMPLTLEELRRAGPLGDRAR
jgi:hypothetical protein